ncbi:hypothetical protein COZ82_01660 [Candidatus Kaiserbacteria bacterium CG_4_8_14_3_um_filter_38_9]|uniref:Uncharacterized protein n=1 Tax=Candidatus Kaiserbacteria bacterium CG_4_8_14_3_um_filter_38_9 TaxID=1974599 RepID=A0A2M7INY1_9BACT|nr:MAG: hypothetical protein COZ82_01660 [Candidatus Kaiserbacteria bacterium CG_4_8_14_3_um_filter_38_9]
MKNKKNILLAFSILLFLFFFLFKNSVNLDLCQQSDYICRAYFNKLERFISPSILLLFFSFLTYKLPNRVFTYWWKFARLAIPAVFFLVILINLRLHHTPGGWMNLDNEIDLLMIYLIYGLFTLGSVIQIVRGFWSKNLLNRRGTLR